MGLQSLELHWVGGNSIKCTVSLVKQKQRKAWKRRHGAHCSRAFLEYQGISCVMLCLNIVRFHRNPSPFHVITLMSLALSGLLSVSTGNSKGIKLIHPPIHADEWLHTTKMLLLQQRFLTVTTLWKYPEVKAKVQDLRFGFTDQRGTC